MASSLLMAMVLLTALAAAVWIDQIQHRIPNWLSAGVLLTGVTAQAVLYGWDGLLAALGGALIAFVVLLILYAMRGMAAGDVKLMTAVGAWLGPVHGLTATAASLVVGGVVALLVMSFHHRRDSTAAVHVLLTARFPYAIAIAIGTAATLIVKGLPWTS